ncbi:MAG: dynamin family protein [Chloroflexi bacterium]|nr:dynamin family protein [Chloroflexota bacterium]
MQLDRDIRLIGAIMSAKAQPDAEVEAAFTQFKALLGEYLKESRHDNFPAEADAYANLNIVKSKMSRMRLAPEILNKNVVAVAGSFSSGKSSFINSLTGMDTGMLPTGITPTTSISTYVQHAPGGSLEISVFNGEGGRVLIDADRLGAMSHDFEREYGIALRKVVRRLVVSTPHLKSWERIVFVDTPGYTNPESDEAAESDEQVALSEIVSAQFLLWIIDCERGALSDTDLNHIKDFLNTKDRKNVEYPLVYIVINKADKKPADQFRRILNTVTDTAANSGIQCAGVSLYSAREGQWYGHWGRTFPDFISKVNKIEPSLTIRDNISAVLDQYVDYHQEQASYFSNRVGLLKRLAFLMDEQLSREGQIGKDVEQAWISAERQADVHKEHATVYLSLCRRFGDCVDGFIDALEEVKFR